MTIYTKLALKMGWFRKIDTGLILGPNLQQEFMGDQIPNMKKNSDWNDVNDEQSNPVFWTVRSFLPDYLQLSMSCSYIPLRNEVIEIIQTQVAETNGELVKFGEGNTIVTLHFKKT